MSSNISLLTYFKREKTRLNEIKCKKNRSKNLKIVLSHQFRLCSSGLVKNVLYFNHILNEELDKYVTRSNILKYTMIEKCTYMWKMEFEVSILELN
ncbi:MAG: hypothetical protein U0T58_00535 [Buchnera aphidicola (Meitanaphis elongallis)]